MEQATPSNAYQDILNRAKKLREAGALNSSELTVIALFIQAIYALGVDISSDIGTLRHNGVPDGPSGGEGETAQMVFPFMRDPGDESPVRSPVPES